MVAIVIAINLAIFHHPEIRYFGITSSLAEVSHGLQSCCSATSHWMMHFLLGMLLDPVLKWQIIESNASTLVRLSVFQQFHPLCCCHHHHLYSSVEILFLTMQSLLWWLFVLHNEAAKTYLCLFTMHCFKSSNYVVLYFTQQPTKQKDHNKCIIQYKMSHIHNAALNRRAQVWLDSFW